MKDLTKLEETVLVIIWKLDSKAYGVNIKKQVNKITGKNYFYNTIYTTFDQLLRKGYVQKYFGEPTSVRGGKRKAFFQITKEGIEALELAYERQGKVWFGITKDSFKKGFAS
jgi:DNA-binding PadR family transcriptional regulator